MKRTALFLAGILAISSLSGCGAKNSASDSSEPFEGKTIYVLCNSGARGAAKATQLLKEAGITNVFTIENGAKSEVIQKHFVTDPVADPDTKKDNNGKDNNKNLNNGKTTTAATSMTYAVPSFAAVIASFPDTNL